MYQGSTCTSLQKQEYELRRCSTHPKFYGVEAVINKDNRVMLTSDTFFCIKEFFYSLTICEMCRKKIE